MSFPQDKSRPYQLSMAVVCTLLASGGFVGAGYVGTSTADAAAAVSALEPTRTPATFNEAAPAGFDAFAEQGLGVKISFANTLILAQKPPAKQVFDLTDPNGNTPHLAPPVNAMRGDVPEISAELISQVRKDILTAAYQGLGHRYVWGGTSFENGWDCSGFVQWAYRQAGVILPRTEQWLPMVETNNPQPGDIVVQNPDGPNHWSHIGIYLGNGKMISALNPSVGTIIHAPGDVSSSSTYFTMPAFAAADEKAKADAAKNTAGDETNASLPASAMPTQTTPSTTAPGTTAPATTAPKATPPKATAPGTPAPSTPAPTTAPATTPPKATAPGTPAPSTPPSTTAPATTPPKATAPGTPAPSTPAPTTPPATTPAPSTPPKTTAPGTPSPATTPPKATAPGTTDPATCVPTTTAPAASVPGSTAPATVDPGSTVPATTAPSTSVPRSTDPAVCVPGSTAPATVHPTTTEAAAPTAAESDLPATTSDAHVSSLATEPRISESTGLAP